LLFLYVQLMGTCLLSRLELIDERCQTVHCVRESWWSVPAAVLCWSIALWSGMMGIIGHGCVCCYRSIVRATEELKRNAKLISTTVNNIGFAAAIFEPAPLKSRGTSLGVTVQLVTTFLYMANYNLVIPTVDQFMKHLEVCIWVTFFVLPVLGLCTTMFFFLHPPVVLWRRGAVSHVRHRGTTLPELDRKGSSELSAHGRSISRRVDITCIFK
jgi:hypothetical protein